jgi:23S rRNA pseudouridine1911/1915/1917 synthase
VPGPSRLDRWLRDTHPELSWRQIRDAIEQGQVTVDDRVERDPGREVRGRAEVRLDRNRPAQRPSRAPFDVLHEDEHILVINKPAGVLSIPTTPEQRDVEDTILRRARTYANHKWGRRAYAGMLHRLDRDTSGALAIALSKEAHASGRDLFKHHRFERHYLAVVQRVPTAEQGTIESRISSEYRDGRRRVVSDDEEGMDATTHYVVRERFAHAALLELELHTGRQHQIRLHLQTLGHPLFGEQVYLAGEPSPLKVPRAMLHAWTLAFPHPITNQRVAAEAPIPRDFERLLRTLRSR